MKNKKLNNLKLRTRIIAIVCLLIFAMYSGVNATIRLKDPSGSTHGYWGDGNSITDDNGKSWTVTGANLQAAINDSDSYSTGNNHYNGGFIYVGSDIDISTPIYAKSNVIVDFQYHTVNITADVDFWNCTNVNHSQLRNVVVNLPSTYTSEVITLYGDSSNRNSYNLFEDITFNACSLTNPRNYTGIKIHLTDNASAVHNIFTNFEITQCDRAIWLKASGYGGMAYSNEFKSFWINKYKTAMVDFDCDGTVTDSFYRNEFYGIKAQTNSDSLYGFRNISNSGNVFIDCHVWDWYVASNGVYAWSLQNHPTRPALDTIIISPGAEWSNTMLSDFDSANTMILSNNWGSKNFMLQDALYMPVYPDNNNLGIHLSFSNGSGTDVFDYSGNSNHGTITSNHNWTDGKYGANTAIQLDGVSEYVNVSDDNTLDFGTGNFTVECWLKYPLSSVGSNDGFISKGITSSAPDHSWGICSYSTNTDGIQYLDAANGGGSWNANDLLIASGITAGWHHFVVTRSGTSYKLYMDGTLEDNSTHTAVDLSSSAPLRISRNNGSNYIGCTVDDLKIYTRALTQDEIRTYWLRGQPNKFNVPTVNMSSNQPGDGWFDCVTNTEYRHNGTAWVSITFT